ncbi:MAG: nicotinate (nicotinamide) nucleotide adenylyltransferase [Clostridia bacterium]|nr:nicotinate (nicotinamide) nucleotide adenylyltransferase [Clostridia bacterium]
MKQNRIGVFGGSFHPVHNGHLSLARHAAEALGIERVLFVIDRIPPHKTLAGGASDEERLAILRLATEDDPLFSVETLELYREGTSYTVDTLRELKERYPDAELCFFMGSDMLNAFTNWRSPEVISRLATLVCTVRTGQSGGERETADMLFERFGTKVILLDEVSPLSSTLVRDCIRDALPIQDMIPKKAEHYIYLHGCYAPEELRPMYERLHRELKPQRMEHTAYVIETAIALAARFGADPKKARLAALLHDCAKYLPEGLLLPYADTEPPMMPILHAPAGADYAKEVYGVSDPEVLEAIRLHTTGDANMTLLDKIIYLADMIEPSRSFEGVDEIRNASTPDEMMRLALLRSIWYIKENGSQIHPATLRALHDLGGTMERFGESEVLAICKLLYDKKATDILALHIGDKTIIADWFVVASGTSVTHVRALCDELEEKAESIGLSIRRKEGYEDARWIVLDFGFALVHLFHPEEREYYKIERLWEGDDNMIRYPVSE